MRSFRNKCEEIEAFFFCSLVFRFDILPFIEAGLTGDSHVPEFNGYKTNEGFCFKSKNAGGLNNKNNLVPIVHSEYHRISSYFECLLAQRCVLFTGHHLAHQVFF